MVKTKKYTIIWSDTAKNQLKEIYKADTLKTNNNGAYRAYIVFSYRIVYKINNSTIDVLRIKHTSREPLEY